MRFRCFPIAAVCRTGRRQGLWQRWSARLARLARDRARHPAQPQSATRLRSRHLQTAQCRRTHGLSLQGPASTAISKTSWQTIAIAATVIWWPQMRPDPNSVRADMTHGTGRLDTRKTLYLKVWWSKGKWEYRIITGSRSRLWNGIFHAPAQRIWAYLTENPHMRNTQTITKTSPPPPPA